LVKLSLKDIVNKVPEMHQKRANSKLYLREIGTLTLDIEFINGQSQKLLFKGLIRESIEANGRELEISSTITANQKMKRQLKRWAKALTKNMNNISK
jgi:hypothetical protein